MVFGNFEKVALSSPKCFLTPFINCGNHIFRNILALNDTIIVNICECSLRVRYVTPILHCRYHYYSHFTDEETETQRGQELFQDHTVCKLWNQIGIQVLYLESPHFKILDSYVNIDIKDNTHNHFGLKDVKPVWKWSEVLSREVF